MATRRTGSRTPTNTALSGGTGAPGSEGVYGRLLINSGLERNPDNSVQPIGGGKYTGTSYDVPGTQLGGMPANAMIPPSTSAPPSAPAQQQVTPDMDWNSLFGLLGLMYGGNNNSNNSNNSQGQQPSPWYGYGSPWGYGGGDQGQASGFGTGPSGNTQMFGYGYGGPSQSNNIWY